MNDSLNATGSAEEYPAELSNNVFYICYINQVKFASGSLRLISCIGVGIDNDSKYRRSHLILAMAAMLNHCTYSRFSFMVINNFNRCFGRNVS